MTRKNLLLFSLSMIITLVVCELLTRIIFPQSTSNDIMFQVDENIGWKFIPNKKTKIIYEGGINHYMKINEEGYRDTPFSKKNEEAKIIVLGDSFVSNISVKNEEVFTLLMEDQLAETSVYNLGVNGYGQVQEYMLLKEWLPKIQPNLIVLFIYLRNDFSDNIGKYPWLYPRPTVVFDTVGTMQINPPSLMDFNREKTSPFYYRSHLFLFIIRRINKIKNKNSKVTAAAFVPPEVQTCRSPISEETKTMYETMEKLILHINQYCRNINTPIVFALVPSMFQVEDDLWSELIEQNASLRLQNNLPNKKLLAFAKQNNLEMIDLMPALQKAHRSGNKMYNSYEQHWTVQGNKLVADVVSEYIKQRIIK